MGSHLAPINRVLCSASPEHPRHSEGSIIVLQDGRLFLAWTDFYAGKHRDEEPAAIMGMWSEDDGTTWTNASVVQENIGRLNVMSPSLLLLPSGRLLMAFHRKDGQPTECHIMVKWSDDAGKSWSDPRPITQGMHYWCATNDRLVRLTCGRVIIPVGRQEFGTTMQLVYFSDDNGESWRYSTIPVLAPPGGAYAEPVVVEIADGSLLMLLRALGGYIRYARSFDQGERWTEWHPGDSSLLSSPHAPSNCKRIPGSNDLLLVWNNNGSRRIPLTSAVSSDGARSWKHIRDLEPYLHCPPMQTYSYPSIAFSSGCVHLTYWQTWRAPKTPQTGIDVEGGHDVVDRRFSLKYRRLPLAWFYEVEPD
jgi:sialidase-1